MSIYLCALAFAGTIFSGGALAVTAIGAVCTGDFGVAAGAALCCTLAILAARGLEKTLSV